MRNERGEAMRRTIQVNANLDPNTVQSILRQAYGEDVTVIWQETGKSLAVSYGGVHGIPDDPAKANALQARVLGIADGFAYPTRAESMHKLINQNSRAADILRKMRSGLFSKAAIDIMADGFLKDAENE